MLCKHLILANMSESTKMRKSEREIKGKACIWYIVSYCKHKRAWVWAEAYNLLYLVALSEPKWPHKMIEVLSEQKKRKSDYR